MVDDVGGARCIRNVDGGDEDSRWPLTIDDADATADDVPDDDSTRGIGALLTTDDGMGGPELYAVDDDGTDDDAQDEMTEELACAVPAAAAPAYDS